MTISSFSNAFVSTMLGWLKGVANWVLRLFNLAGSSGVSPLLWLSRNWIVLLVFFLLLGVILDVVVWLVRWRPYWVWFRKERVIVNDEKFFAGGRIEHERFTSDDELMDGDWQERDYVVASTVATRPERRERAEEGEEHPRRRRSEATRVPQRRSKSKARHRGTFGTIVKRMKSPGDAAEEAAPVPPEAEERPATEDALFEVFDGSPGVTDSFEDEVFNVSSLPDPVEFDGSAPGEDDLFAADDEN